MEVLILALLILLNGAFAMAEIALVTARRSRLARLAEDGDASSAIAIRLREEPTRFLSTIQIGITAIGILNGVVGESALATPFALWMQGLGLEVQLSELAATGLVVAVITYFTIVIGELLPKRLAQLNPEGIARLVAHPIRWLAILSRPFVWLLSVSTDTLLRLMGKQQTPAASVTEEDIQAMLMEGSQAGIIEQQEHAMVRNVFRLDERLIGSMMVPRADIVYLDLNDTLEANLERVSKSDHSRFPVCRGGLQEILGVISTKQLFQRQRQQQPLRLDVDLQPCTFVPETLTGLELMQKFRDAEAQMMIVVDEYGEAQGMITLRDALEAITGEFKPSRSEEAWAVQRKDGSWLLDGMIPIPELKDRLNLKAVPEEGRARFHTLSGMLMWLLENLPNTGDVVEWEDWRFEVVDLDGKRVDKVLATRNMDTAEPTDIT